MTQRWKWTPEISADVAAAEQRVRDRWARRLEPQRQAFLKRFEAKEPAAEEEIRLFDVEMRTVEDATR